jgi:myo-inositol-1(or 4)-monophosphatase
MEYPEFAIRLARKAGDVLKHYAARDKAVEFKGRANLVTVADRESEALIVGEIRRAYPDHAILAEESGPLERSGTPGRHRWIVDPLDGTTNYAHQYPMYSVSIALEVDGEVLCGAVYDPVREEMFSAARGQGAFLNGEPIHVSGTARLGDALLLTGFPYGIEDRIARAMGLFRAFLLEAQAVRRAGSAALDLCHLAMGRCDGFWELDLHPWDTAAGILIAAEAGGRVSGFEGEPFAIDAREILVSNGCLHDEMIAAIRSARPVDAGHNREPG